jgi:hypothetical protein
MSGDQGIAISAAADGSMAQGGIVFDDPDSTMSVIGWQPVYVVETLCTAAPRLGTGYIGDRTYRRGHYRTGGGREIDTTVLDSNVLLQMHRINGGDSLRPEETAAARIAWLLASGYIPLVADLGLVNTTGTLTYDATQYKGQFPSDVLNDLCGPREFIFFVYWDQSAAALGLFFDAPTATTFTSTLTISNVLSDVDNVTCFTPYNDAESMLDPSEVYSHLRYVYAGGVYYAGNAATDAAFFPSPLLHRDTVVENMLVGKTSTAITFANRILARDAVENQIITMTVKLPASKVGLIDAGMRLNVRLSHVPGFTSFAYTRVEQITKAQTEGTPDFYDVGLRLSTHGIVGGGGTGGGSTLPFPISSGTPPPLVQSAIRVDGSFFSPSPGNPTDGNLLVAWMVERSGATYPPIPTGWTSQATCVNSSSVYGPGNGGRLVYKIASGDTATSIETDFTIGGVGTTFMEWGATAIGASVAVSDVNANNASLVLACGPITPSAANAIVVGCAVQGTFGCSTVATPDAGVTQLGNFCFPGGNDPTNWVGYKTVTTPAATTVGGMMEIGGRNEYGFVVLTLLPATGADPTLPGGPVINEFVANGDGTTVLFTTAQPYAPLSLHVRVDGVPIILGLIETDSAAGTFTLDFAPLGAIGDSPAETVYVDYVAA